MKRLAITAWFILTTSAGAFAQGLAIDVRQANEDIIGKQFTYDLREQIARSAQYHLAELGEPDVVLLVQSMDPFKALPEPQLGGHATVVSVTALLISAEHQGVYIASQIFTIGRDKTTDGAKQAIATLDSQLRKPIPIFKP